MLDHETYVDMETAHSKWLPVARFKRKMDISDLDWDASQPRATIELRKGRRDMLRRVLEAAERLEHYSYADVPAISPASPVPALPTSSALGAAVDDFIAEHSRQRDVSPMVEKHCVNYLKSISRIISNLNIAIFDLFLFFVL